MGIPWPVSSLVCGSSVRTIILHAAVIHGLVIARWDWHLSCCVFTVPRTEAPEDGSQHQL